MDILYSPSHDGTDDDSAAERAESLSGLRLKAERRPVKSTKHAKCGLCWCTTPFYTHLSVNVKPVVLLE